MPNYLSQYTLETLPRFEDCVVFNGTQVYFTPAGIRRYRDRFALAGFDIAAIRDAEQLQEAIAGSFHIEMACLAQLRAERRGARTGDPLEWALWDAMDAGDTTEIARLKRKLRHRRRAGLKVVTLDTESGGQDA